MLSDNQYNTSPKALSEAGLNAPFGARCFLTCARLCRAGRDRLRLNAPFGARCFLTLIVVLGVKAVAES